jgi:hypothetical protein
MTGEQGFSLIRPNRILPEGSTGPWDTKGEGSPNKLIQQFVFAATGRGRQKTGPTCHT